MIRLRGADGKEIELPKQARFIELCDQDGAPGLVIYQDTQGAIHEMTQGHPDAARYERVTGVKFVPVVRR